MIRPDSTYLLSVKETIFVDWVDYARITRYHETLEQGKPIPFARLGHFLVSSLFILCVERKMGQGEGLLGMATTATGLVTSQLSGI